MSTYDVTQLPDNEQNGFGPSYVSETGRVWVGYLADSFYPAVYWLDCASIDEAWEHFQCVLCPVWDITSDPDLTEAQRREVWENGSGYGYSVTEDGEIRYTESFKFREMSFAEFHATDVLANPIDY